MNTNQSTTTIQAQQRKGRMIVLLMLVFFIVPIIVVVAMYKLNWKPMGESFGDLIKPPVQLSNPAQLQLVDGSSVSPVLWKQKWSVVYIADQCEAVCNDKLKDMRQLHVSLYKDIMRTQRVLITNTINLDKIKQDFPDIVIINQSQSAVSTLVNQFKVDELNPLLANRLYFVDPLGFLMMRYQSDADLALVRKDLTRLLKTSWAG